MNDISLYHRGELRAEQAMQIAVLIKSVWPDVDKSLDEAPKGISLFQTGVPGFYEKLGAVIVENRFWNSTSDDPEKSPWWNKYVMVYSNNTEWPAGQIDLNGMGY